MINPSTLKTGNLRSAGLFFITNWGDAASIPLDLPIMLSILILLLVPVVFRSLIPFADLHAPDDHWHKKQDFDIFEVLSAHYYLYKYSICCVSNTKFPKTCPILPFRVLCTP